MDKSRLTQELVNAFPLESEIRTSDQSQGFSILNSIALQNEEILRQLKELGDSYYLSTANLNTIDNLWLLDLGQNYTFAEDPNNAALSYLKVPTVSGITASGNIVAVNVSTDNSLQKLQLAYPSRVTLHSSTSGQDVLWNGYAKDSFTAKIDGPVHSSKLNITVVSGSNYLGLDNTGNVIRGRLQIDGITYNDLTSSEAVVFLHDATRSTDKIWKSISSISALDISPDNEAFITIRDHDFLNAPYRDFWNFEQNDSRELTDTFWELEDSVTGGYKVLSKRQYQFKGLSERIASIDLNLETVVPTVLLTSSGVAPSIKDIAYKPYTNLIYAIDKDTLYVYNDSIPLPSRKLLDKVADTPDRLAIIQPSTYWANYGETVSLDLYFAQPMKSIQRHKLSIKYPDGTNKAVKDGKLYSMTDNEGWLTGDPINRRLRPTENIQLTQFGIYVFTLETQYTDGTKDWDQIAISVLSKKPLVEMTIHHLLPKDITASGIDFDTLTLKPRILANDKRRYLLNEHKDLFIVDFANKKLFFNEKYDSVRVMSS